MTTAEGMDCRRAKIKAHFADTSSFRHVPFTATAGSIRVRLHEVGTALVLEHCGPIPVENVEDMPYEEDPLDDPAFLLPMFAR